MENLPDILCIGHVCHDETDTGPILGGSASYCSIVASKLQKKAAILTSVGPDFRFKEVFENYAINVHYLPAKKTTVFKNIYHNSHRIQYLKQRADTILSSDLPTSWKHVKIVKFCLIADEVDPRLMTKFPHALIGATIQGWLRQWDETGRVHPKEMDWNLLRNVHVVCMSRDDILGYEDKIALIADLVDVLVVTNGQDHAEVYHQGRITRFPAYPVHEVDPTGAGDVFAATFLIKYAENRNIHDAAIYAHCAASLVVEGVGIHNLDDLNRLESRVRDYRSLYPQLISEKE